MKLVTIKTVSYLTVKVDTLDDEKAVEMVLKGDYVGAYKPTRTREVVMVNQKMIHRKQENN